MVNPTLSRSPPFALKSWVGLAVWEIVKGPRNLNLTRRSPWSPWVVLSSPGHNFSIIFVAFILLTGYFSAELLYPLCAWYHRQSLYPRAACTHSPTDCTYLLVLIKIVLVSLASQGRQTSEADLFFPLVVQMKCWEIHTLETTISFFIVCYYHNSSSPSSFCGD